MDENGKKILRILPSVDEILRNTRVALESDYTRALVADKAREVVDGIRKQLLAGKFTGIPQSRDEILSFVINKIEKVLRKLNRPSLRRVINATGVVLHTNLGRALLGCRALEAINQAGSYYNNLEFNLDTGRRGSRYDLVEDKLTRLTGAEAALVVNNNAAAVLLVLKSLAEGREVVVSRGQLVEIGGSFRIPDVMQQSGARLVEVGTTNKTYPRDYRAAITADTALLLHVHTSNYRIVGFTRETTVAELATLGREFNLPVVSDLGSGFFIDLSQYGYPYEPTVQETVSAGADVVTFSGDKLLGGPQAGIIVGKKEYLDVMKRNPLTRALRPDKLTLAALEATLHEYFDPERARRHIPTLRMLTDDKFYLYEKARTLAELLKDRVGPWASLNVLEVTSQVGGGAMPLAQPPSFAVALGLKHHSLDEITRKLREADPAVVGRVQEGLLLLDVRTIQEDELELLSDIIGNILAEEAGHCAL
ncbi:MAG: L-seryl-tRNA(Sec) selenium transferase [Peptococcaceae bacterium]|nr:L-seryl-tRNA(Sec) selenium transferase [Peptococcaceae bacterium]